MFSFSFLFLMCTSQGHRCGVFISCNHCVTLNCSLRSNNINFFGPLCWGKYRLSLRTQPETSNLRPSPLHTPMEIKGWVGDSWPLLRTDCCTRVQLKGKCFCAFQGRLPGTDRTETFRYKKRFKTTFKGRINHVNESLRRSKFQLPLFDLPIFTLSALVSKCLLESGDRSYWSLFLKKTHTNKPGWCGWPSKISKKVHWDNRSLDLYKHPNLPFYLLDLNIQTPLLVIFWHVGCTVIGKGK